MLVLTRTIGQKLLLHRSGELIAEIHVVESHGDGVRLGFDKMPDDLIVTRGELERLFERRKSDKE